MSPPARAPFAAPSAVVDCAKAALDASSDAAANEIARRVFMCSFSSDGCALTTSGARECSGSAAMRARNNRSYRYSVTVHAGADFVVRHQFQRPHHRRVIPALAAMRGAGRKQLLRHRRAWQRQAKRACAFEREVEILLVQLDAEA